MQRLAMVEHDGCGSDAKGISQLPEEKITRGNFVQVGERYLTRRNGGGAQQQGCQRKPLQKGRQREKPSWSRGRPDIKEVGTESAHHHGAESDRFASAKPRHYVMQ